MLRRLTALVTLAVGALAFSAGGCSRVEHLLEGPVNLDARLSIAVDSAFVSLAKGGTRTLEVAVTRIGDYSGAIALTVEQLPTGVTALIDNERTVGAVTTARVTLTASTSTIAASFIVLLRARADRVSGATSQVTLTVTPPLDFTLASSEASSTVARGGHALTTVSVSRINFGAPITLSLEGDAGITAEFGENPLTVSGTTVRLAVAPTVAVGSYTMRWRAQGTGVTDRTLPFTVSVTNDPLQLLAVPTMTVAQAGTAQSVLIVNRVASVPVPTLSIEQLPVGVTATTSPLASDGTSTLRLTAGPDARPGVTSVLVRAAAAGVPDATAVVQVTVLPASIALALGATALDVFQGTAARVSATVTRSSFTGGVQFALESAPAGLSVTATPDSQNGNLTSLSFTASGSATPGTYPVVVVAQPIGLNASAAQRVTLTVTVRPTSANGNVLLDWSTCTVPSWVAAQDGAGAWQPLSPVNGTFRFNVTTDRGAYAYVEDGTTTVVRYRMQSELTSGPIDMCPPRIATKIVRGVGAHTGIGETWTYMLGGGVAQTTVAQQTFTMSGVAYGTHDLVAWAPYNTVFHALLRRDQNIPDGEALDAPVSLVGPESFTVARTLMTIGNGLNESLSHTMAYLTTSACTVNPLYSNGPHGTTPAVWGIPEQFQRSTDYHLLTVNSSSTTAKRSISTAFRIFGSRTIDMPPLLPLPSLTTLGGTSKRFRMALGSLPPAFNETIEFRYGDGLHFVRLNASVSYVGTQNLSLSAPDFSAVGDYPTGVAIAPSAIGTWTMTATGATAPGSPCQENRSSVSSQRSGAFQ